MHFVGGRKREMGTEREREREREPCDNEQSREWEAREKSIALFLFGQVNKKR